MRTRSPVARRRGNRSGRLCTIAGTMEAAGIEPAQASHRRRAAKTDDILATLITRPGSRALEPMLGATEAALIE